MDQLENGENVDGRIVSGLDCDGGALLLENSAVGEEEVQEMSVDRVAEDRDILNSSMTQIVEHTDDVAVVVPPEPPDLLQGLPHKVR